MAFICYGGNRQFGGGGYGCYGVPNRGNWQRVRPKCMFSLSFSEIFSDICSLSYLDWAYFLLSKLKSSNLFIFVGDAKEI